MSRLIIGIISFAIVRDCCAIFHLFNYAFHILAGTIWSAKKKKKHVWGGVVRGVCAVFVFKKRGGGEGLPKEICLLSNVEQFVKQLAVLIKFL